MYPCRELRPDILLQYLVAHFGIEEPVGWQSDIRRVLVPLLPMEFEMNQVGIGVAKVSDRRLIINSYPKSNVLDVG